MLLFLLMIGVSETLGQEPPSPSGIDYRGYYYIANFTGDGDKTKGYDVSTPATNYYLCPAKPAPDADENYNYDAIYYDGDSKQQPYLTTYRTGRVEAAMWKVEFATTISGVDYYYIRCCSDNNKYLTHNKSKAAKNTRFTVHLQATAGTDKESLFCFETTDDESFNIRPQKVSVGSRHINPANGNKNYYYGNAGTNTTINGNTVNPGGMIGYWSADGADGYASRWYLERVQPTISYNSTNHEIEISNIDQSVTIYYTDDGTNEPTTGQTEKKGESPIVITEVNNSVSIKAIAAKSDVLPSPVSEIRVVPSATVSVGTSPITYNGSAQEPAVTVKDGDTPIPPSEYDVSYGNNTNAGDATVTITNATGGTFIVYGSTTFTITPKALTITADDASKVYDGTPLTKESYTNTALAAGDDIESVTVTGSQTVFGTSNNVPSAAVIKNANNDEVTACYEITYANGTLEVTRKALTITADDASKVYDGTPLTKESYTNTALATGDAIESVTVTGSQTDVGTSNNVPSAAVIKNADDVEVTTSYEITYANGTLTITGAPVTVKADDKSKNPNDPDPELTATVTGLLGTDVISYTLSREAGETAGEYAIIPTGETIQGNYIVTYVNGVFTIRGISIKPNFTWIVDAESNVLSNAVAVALFVNTTDKNINPPAGVMVYIVTGIANDLLVLRQIDCIPMNVPVLLVFNNQQFENMAASEWSGEDQDTSGNLLDVASGTDDQRTFGVGQIYLYYNGEFLLNMPGRLKEGTIYLKKPSSVSSGARLRFSRAASTGISGMNDDDYTDCLDGRWFTIDGRRLNGKPTKKGLYILNGEKVVIK